LEAGWVTSGPKTRQFEAEFADYVGAKHAVAVNSCTAAMHLALEAIGLGEGDEVITSPFTFAATAEVIRYFNARPVLVDIEPRNYTEKHGTTERTEPRNYTEKHGATERHRISRSAGYTRNRTELRKEQSHGQTLNYTVDFPCNSV